MAKKSVVVVGSGIAGLTAAHRLKQNGFDVTVLEAANFAGGRMADINIKGLNLHSGATIMWTFYHEMMDLIKEFNLKDDIRPWHKPETLVDNGEQIYPIRYHFDTAFMMTHPVLKMSTKVKLSKLLPVIFKSSLTVDPNLMDTAADFDDATMSDYLLGMGLGDFLENYIDPLFRGPWNWKVDKISRAYLISILGHLAGSKTFTFKEGIGALTRRMASSLDVHLGCRVETIGYDNDGKGREVRFTGPNGPGKLNADIVVCAVEGNKVASIVEDLSPEEKRFFESVKYTDVGIVYYILKKKPGKYSRWFTSKHRSKFVIYDQFDEDPRVPEGHIQPPHLYCELTPEVKEIIKAENSQNHLDAYARSQALEFYPSLEEDLEDVVEQWFDEMLPEWYVGYAKEVRDFLTNQEAKSRSLYYCGDYLSHSHTGGACASGAQIARIIKNHHVNPTGSGR